ncbi:MAG: anaerobic ribonucleoside-triphosphate reductase activating protein [Candidatus Omnitrophota bacterium]
MRIGGLQKISLIDYPGNVAAVVFTQGCNFRCPYCHNVNLVSPACFADPISEYDVLDFLSTRVEKLKGVVVTGGEPTLQPDLPEFLQKIRTLGFLVKLDTNGSRPAVLRWLIDEGLVDFIAMDIKAPLERYDEVAGVRVKTDYIRQSIDLIKGSGISYQFRTTVVKSLLSETDIGQIADMLGDIEYYRLQNFAGQDVLLDNSLLDQAHFTEEELSRLRARWERHPQSVCS